MLQLPKFETPASSLEGYFIAYRAHNGLLLFNSDLLMSGWLYLDGALEAATEEASSDPDRSIIVAQVINANGDIHKYYEVINRFTSGNGLTHIEL